MTGGRPRALVPCRPAHATTAREAWRGLLDADARYRDAQGQGTADEQAAQWAVWDALDTFEEACFVDSLAVRA